MPVLVTLQFPEGHKYEDVKKTMSDVTNVLADDLNEPPTNIRVTVREMPLNRYSVGGILRYELEENKENEK